MLLKEILYDKGHHVHAIDPDATLDDAVSALVRHNIGSLLVRHGGADDGAILGIITERDILRAQALHRAPLDQLRVGSMMTADLVTASPEDDITVAMLLMTTHRVRHLPIVFDQELFGLVSIGDIVKAHHDLLELENHHIRSYILGDRAEPVLPG